MTMPTPNLASSVDLDIPDTRVLFRKEAFPDVSKSTGSQLNPIANPNGEINFQEGTLNCLKSLVYFQSYWDF
jgi:hypothetical protein